MPYESFSFLAFTLIPHPSFHAFTGEASDTASKSTTDQEAEGCTPAAATAGAGKLNHQEGQAAAATSAAATNTAAAAATAAARCDSCALVCVWPIAAWTGAVVLFP